MTLQNYIGGALTAPAAGAYIDNIEPATGAVYSRIPDSGAVDVDAAVAAAAEAAPVWAAMHARERCDLLLRVAALIDEHADALALAESTDTGKPLWLARSLDIPRASQNFHFFGTAALHFASESHTSSENVINYTLRRPAGIAGCISPWNLPLYLFTWKIAPALATGNCVVAKPSEITPVTAHMLSQLCIDAGLPPGVLNIVHGRGATVGAAITAHPAIGAISFTGGTKTGADIARVAAPMFKKLSLELGGKNPTVVFADCDFDAMIDTVVRSSFSNQGEICLCGSRLFVERPLLDRFTDAFLERVRALVVGDPLDDATRQGAVVSRAHMEKVLSYVDLAIEEGGTVLCGGERVRLEGRCADGFFVAPTVITGLGPLCRTNQEEIFGPVVTIIPFDSEAELLAAVNSTPYGLAASVWTQDIARAQRMARDVACGIVWINCWMLRDLRTPFGGMKSSGVGREGGWEAMRFFTEPKNVCIRFPD
ncbi:MAG: aldehyde dehydrogenase [Ignavibacteria bacterium]|nr:aldehyde dehydrogenase [Ignavibacteria bacterium]